MPVSINNNPASNVLFLAFWIRAEAVLLIRDEDPKALEVIGWIPFTKCKSPLRLLPWYLAEIHCNSSPRFSQRKKNPGGTSSATRWSRPLSCHPADSSESSRRQTDGATPFQANFCIVLKQADIKERNVLSPCGQLPHG
jgi:hypothetical protein